MKKTKSIIDFTGFEFAREKTPSMRLKARRAVVKNHTARNVRGILANLFGL